MWRGVAPSMVLSSIYLAPSFDTSHCVAHRIRKIHTHFAIAMITEFWTFLVQWQNFLRAYQSNKLKLTYMLPIDFFVAKYSGANLHSFVSARLNRRVDRTDSRLFSGDWIDAQLIDEVVQYREST